MRWPPWSSSEKDSDDKKGAGSWTNSLNATDWSHYTDPRTVVPTLLLTSAILASVRIYSLYLRRIPDAGYIRPGFFRRRSLLGIVTRVGDGDNFHLFHTPGGRLAGWGWMPGRKIPEKGSELKGKTIAIRLAGVDAPEAAHFGKPAQPHSAESLAWLRSYILNQRVRAYLYRRDQYDRVVATVWVRKYGVRKDVGREMLNMGMATVYEAKMGAEFGDFESKYRRTEAWAKWWRRGIWAGRAKDFESPREYKTRMAAAGHDPKSGTDPKPK